MGFISQLFQRYKLTTIFKSSQLRLQENQNFSVGSHNIPPYVLAIFSYKMIHMPEEWGDYV